MSSSNTVSVSCRCGAVAGDAILDVGSRLVCYCADCQAFARWLHENAGAAEGIVDDDGGTELWQMRPASLRITTGSEQVRSVMLADKGMVRFYAACCGTPLGNQMQNPGVPFVGVPSAFLLPDVAERDRRMGVAVRGQVKAAKRPVKGDTPKELALVIARSLRLIVGGYVAGAAQPSPYRTADGAPRSPPRVLSAAERDALRP